MVWWFFKKREKDELKGAFDAVKKDIKKASEWVSHLHKKTKDHEEAVGDLNSRLKVFDSRLSSMEGQLNDIKTFISFFNTRVFKQPFKQPQTAVDKQTAVGGVQTGVQTAVQSAFLNSLSVMERAVVWVLLNTDLKLSCEDIASVTGKEKSTIRGQLNSIRQKSEGLIEENIEKTGKKRFFIPEDIKEMMMSSIKTNKEKPIKKEGKSETYIL